jgi:signal transduction histidine kinase
MSDLTSNHHHHGASDLAGAPLDAHELRACLRDLVSLLALPATWSGRDPEAVVQALLDVLVGVLRLDLVYGCVDVDGDGRQFARAVRAAARPNVNGQEVAITRCLAPLIAGEDGAVPLEVANPLGDEPLRAVRMPLGLTDDGYIIAASCRSSFPTQHEQLLLRVATNQALMGLQEARLLKQRASAEERERERARAASLAAAVGEAFTRRGALGEKLRRIAQSIVDHLDAALARIWTFNESDQMLELRARAGQDTDLDGPPGRIRLGDFEIGRIAQSRQPIVTNSVGTDPQIGDPEWVRRKGMVAFAGFPIVVEDRLVGVVDLLSRAPLADSIVKALASIADELALGIDRERADDERERLLGATQRHVGLLRGLSQASLAINSSASVDEVLQKITVAARELIGAHQSVTSMTTGDDWAQALNAVSLSDKYAAYRGYAEKPNGSGIYSVVCRLNKTFRMTQAELEAHPAWRGFGNERHRHPSMRGWLAVPLIARDGTNIGLIQATDKYAGEFTEEDETILVQLAQLAAVAIENAQFQRDTETARDVAEQEARRTAQLQRTTAAFAGTISLADVGSAATDAVDVLGAAAAVVYFARGDGTFQWASHRGFPSEVAEWQRLDPHAPLPLSTAMRTGEPVWVTGYQELVAAYPAVALSTVPSERLQAVAALPLKLHGRVLGGIAFSFADERWFSAPERDVLLSLAQQCAQAVERANLLEAERAARAELQQTVYYNEVFAGILAHDLRNPLGAIVTAAHLLLLQRQEGDGDRFTKPLNRIVSSGDRMARMIEQLLDFTRIRVGGGIRIVPQETDLGELCRRVVGELEDANPAWTMNVETSGNMIGQWDPDRLQQVVSNLAANAVQHGEPDTGLRIRLAASADEIELRVQNKGVIPAELLPSLFDPFRGTQLRRAHARGLGLGLFITKEIVVAHGGAVNVESSHDARTTFIVRLPRRKAPAESGVAAADGSRV